MQQFGDNDNNDSGLRGFDTVRVPRARILEKLKENRAEHRRLFEEALEGWHQQVLEALKEQLKRARADKLYNPRWVLPMPQDHTRDYDQVIELIEYSLDEEFELTAREFAQYVRDDWGWKGDFIATASSYSASVAAQYGSATR